jgi:redox-sensitive bicupin YhaK (pirin superfamily)
MITVRPASQRGHGQHGWLDTHHTFSFNDYHDPRHMGFRVLRVINEDRVEAGRGFGTHGHQDMEILSYVLDGALGHKDSLGNGSVLRTGEVQCMTAGTGIRHSEFNASESKPVHFYQVWLLPDRRGLAPRYDQRAFPEAERRGQLRVVASPDGRDGSLKIHQDAEVLLATLAAGERVTHDLASGRSAWLQVLRGSVQLNGVPLATSDGAAVSDESSLTVLGTEPSEVMLFDLP